MDDAEFEQARQDSAKKIRAAQEAKARRGRRRCDNDEDGAGGALVPALPKTPGPSPLAGSVQP